MRRLDTACAATLIAAILGTAGALAQDRSFPSQGIELHHRTAGSGTPVVLLSGGPDSTSTTWFLSEISCRRLPGESFSSNAEPGVRESNMTAETMTLRIVVDDLEPCAPISARTACFWLAIPGAMLAMAYAAAHPDRIDRLILIGSGGPTLEFAERFSDNMRHGCAQEDVDAGRYWESSDRRGVDQDKAALSAMRQSSGLLLRPGESTGVRRRTKDGSFHRVDQLDADGRPGKLRPSRRPSEKSTDPFSSFRATRIPGVTRPRKTFTGCCRSRR